MDDLILEVVDSSKMWQLLRVLFLYDGDTLNHSWRVTRGAAFTADYFGWNVRQTTTVIQAALFHDMGKVFVPHGIITKPARLTHEEFAQVRYHPRQGFNLVRPFFPEAACVLVAHHECASRARHDAHGNYPRSAHRRIGNDRRHALRSKSERRARDRRNLLYELQPLQVAVALADELDALASARSYKSALPDAEVCDKLQQSFGLMAPFVSCLLEQRTEFQKPVPEFPETFPPLIEQSA